MRYERGLPQTRVQRAIAALKADSPIVMVDDRDPRQSHGYLVAPAERVPTATVAFLVRHSSGFLCVGLPAADCDRLMLVEMEGVAGHPRSDFAACVTVDAAHGISTGISAHDRAYTAALLADANATHGDFTRPGHLVPVRIAEGGLAERQGVTEAVAHLMHEAGRRPAAVFAALVGTATSPELAYDAELEAFATAHGLRTVSIGEVYGHYLSTGPLVIKASVAALPSHQAITYRELHGSAHHLAVVTGTVEDATEVIVYAHHCCATGDVGSSPQCDCRTRLHRAQETIATAGRGVTLYLHPSASSVETRMENAGSNCSSMLPFIAASIFSDLGTRSVRLLNDDNDLRSAIQGRGVRVCEPATSVAVAAS